MYFQIENTPEHIRKARRTQLVKKESPKEECPRLILAPFSRPPQVVFDNVAIGSSCERTLEVFNPLKQAQQITLGKALPPGLDIQLPGEWLELEPETCYRVTLLWTPTQPTAMRETIRFTNESRGRYDVIVVLKSAMVIKGKGAQAKSFKISPGKIKKKPAKKSPVAIYKKKSEIIYNTTQIKKTINVIQTKQKLMQVYDKENIVTDDYSMYSRPSNCPFDSPNSIDFNFDTTEVFSNMRKPDLQQTYDKSYSSTNRLNVYDNVLKPSNRQKHEVSGTEIFDDLTFTPLKTKNKTEKLNKGPQIILSLNSESDMDDSLEMKSSNKENQTHSIISITSSQNQNRWLTVNHTEIDSQVVEPTITNKKHPNTSSPKEMNSPNFSINTDFSRISDLSFFPQRFSTERKCFPKMNNDTQDMLDEAIKLSSDTYTKESPQTPFEYQHSNFDQMYEMKPPHYFLKDQPKMCRQALFREYQQQRELHERNHWTPSGTEHNVWQNNLRADNRSPPRSITPPLQSIPEESVQMSDTQVLDKTNRFTFDRTFDKANATTNTQSWSKKAVRAEPDLWKIPITHVKRSMKSRQSLKSKDSLCSRPSNTTFEGNKSINQNISVNLIGNVYSQSFTVDPFLSSTYFYDEEAVHKFEIEFKRWLNCILTPPADLDSNIEQKVDVGKAWIENRNKEIPAAPTKEQVSSVYHNSHRLESLRRSARSLLMTPEIAQVFQKLTVQIEKKLIAIRTDRNLHLDVGLQKIIMEILLSYNPLWLRIGLEAIYGIVLPLKSNSDIEGLTTFIIHRMFKNPFLKNKHAKSNAPNMLLPAYMEAIKKFTLKKFFMLVFFLDQAKQRKLISHDPCLFCRNAICKESREIIIRFTRELIAGIGDITKHLRPLGYVVSHKQSYLDEYKYAVHNIAADIRDGVRLTKVMEIILMKDGLLAQLRTPAISRLQKIHNVQVALTALKEANFVIVGEITATDIADGHREKTLSILWQIIHVFRAPLFERAANVIQTWWRKKYEVIVEKKREAERILNEQNNAASVIQTWWRRIQYNRFVEIQMQQITTATIVIQKYCRMWLCRTRLTKYKTSVVRIEKWYRSVKTIRDAKEILHKLRIEKEELRRKSATLIQTYVRRWLCIKHYDSTLKKIVLIQNLVRRFLLMRKYNLLKKTTIAIQQKYRGKLLMKMEMRNLSAKRQAAIIIQSFYRMIIQRRYFLKLKHAVRVVEERYIALMKMRNERQNYLILKKSVISLQASFRQKQCRQEYLRQIELIIKLQRKIRAQQKMKKERSQFLLIKNSAIVLQKYVRAYLVMKKLRQTYLLRRQSAIRIQLYFRSCLVAKYQRQSYLRLRDTTIVLQRAYKSLLLMRKQRSDYLKLRNATLVLQSRFRAQVMKTTCQNDYSKLREATVAIQRRFRAQIQMRELRLSYLKQKSSCIIIQNAYRAYVLGKQQRDEFLRKKQAALSIQNWFRNCKKGKEVQNQYQQSKQACVTIQRIYRAFIIGRKQRHEFVRIRTASVCIQKYYRTYIEMKVIRREFVKLRSSTVIIQRYYRSHLQTKKQRDAYLQMKTAAVLIGTYYKNYILTKNIRQNYVQLRENTLFIQRRYRSNCAMKMEREKYLKTKQLITNIQHKYKALLAMRKDRQTYIKLRSAAIVIQRNFKAHALMKEKRTRYMTILKSCITIQTIYRAYKEAKTQREQYLKLKQSAIILQQRYRALIEMRSTRESYLKIKTATIIVQRRFRAHRLMLEERNRYLKITAACLKIQTKYRAYLYGKRLKIQYNKLKSAAIVIQRSYRLIRETKKIQAAYQKLRNSVILVQRHFRANKIARALRHNAAASKIQSWYISVRKTNICRQEFLQIKRSIILIQSIFRMRITRQRFVVMRNAALTIQQHYRAYHLATIERKEYMRVRHSIIRVQSYVRSYIQKKRYLRVRSGVLTIQAAYRLKRERDIIRNRREAAAICLQKNLRRYLARSKYLQYRKQVLLIQRIWKGKLVTRLIRCEFLQKRNIIIKIQAIMRGYLVRKQIEMKREDLQKARVAKKWHWAASKIQALFRGNKVRNDSSDKRVGELRRRWRNGALHSTQMTMSERNEQAMHVLQNISGIDAVIVAFESLKLLTQIFPAMYERDAAGVVHRVYTYMSSTNRSVSSVEVLKYAAASLVNLTKYRVTGPKIYLRDRIPPILKFMWRYSNTEPELFCIMATYLWLFSKYETIKEDLTEYVNTPEIHRMLVTIKGNVDRSTRMNKIMKNKYQTPYKSSSRANHSMNSSVCTMGCNIVLPSLEPDYGIVRNDKPQYFEDTQQAINCLFHTYKLCSHV